ncbi:leucyl aminopeptidase [Candidatus Saganbacteria bacterium]|nr:leucyl aminopeptidase [Candidatus Saganbacteria bacterium]
MKIKVASEAVSDRRIVGLFEGEKQKDVPDYFKGKLGQVEVVGQKIVVGLGKREKFDLEAVRTASSAAIKKAREIKAATVSTVIFRGRGLSLCDAAKAIVEGAVLGVYRFAGYAKEKEEPDFAISRLVLVVNDKKDLKSAEKGAELGRIIAEAENHARDLVNEPSNKLTPTAFAKLAERIAKINDLKFTSLDPKAEGLGALLSVAKGSDEPPRLVMLEYRGDPKSKEKIALIGKGITFDSGGISLKPSKKMYEMKCDMAGAAAVLGVMSLLNDLRPKKNVIGVIPLTENMPSGHATKPGDVVTSLSGLTVEIINTDAEGRLILADAVTYAKNLGATKLVDIATLTGGCIVALGDDATGVIGNNQKLIDQIVETGNACGQKMWQLPLYDEFKQSLKSKLADIKNSSETGKAQPSTGAAFIAKFVGDTPWAHLDIAGTAFLDKEHGYLPEGATGVPVRTLIEWLNS